MINSISLQNDHCFSNGVTLPDLKKVNFIFGPNGTGKTTLSQILENPADSSLQWKNNSLKTLVYNRDYVSQNFGQSASMPGIFTLGKNAQIQGQIESKRQELTRKNKGIEKLDKEIEQEGKTFETKRLAIHESCWKVRKKHLEPQLHDTFAEALDGTGRKELFFEKCLKANHLTSVQLRPLSELQQDAMQIFQPAPKLLTIPEQAEDTLAQLEYAQTVMKTRLVGKEDVQIAQLIKKLGNGDWVKAGIPYLRDSEDKTCPFCQQTTPPDLANQLNDYFDETFEKGVQAIENLGDWMQSEFSKFQDHAGILRGLENQYLDQEKLEQLLKVIIAKATLNLERVEEKRKEASREMQLEPLTEDFKKLNEYLRDVELASKKMNEKLGNQGAAKADLKKELWRYLSEQVKEELAVLKSLETAYKNAKQQKESAKHPMSDAKKQLTDELRELEKQVKSIKPTMEAINQILKNYQFTNFRLAEADGVENHYILVREHVADNVYSTLSEGEKTFLSFLYFYHHVKGSDTGDGFDDPRVIIFDDPISSLDSNVLFIVSTLVREFIETVKSADESNLKQLFVFTHNVYFHLEVTYNYEDPGYASFFMLRKKNNYTEAQQLPKNPIKSSYQLLWHHLTELKQSEIPDPYENLFLQNTMRRILETYFIHFGGRSGLEDVFGRLAGEHRKVGMALLKHLHVNSHHAVRDDEFLEPVMFPLDVMFATFREIFKVLGHDQHYDLMMRQQAIEVGAS